MTPERYEQLAQIFQAASELDPAERMAFVEKVCSGDEQLRRDLETLLASDEQLETFLDTPAFEIAAKMLAKIRHSFVAGTKIGNYEILYLLGEGGMGEVYLARDTKLSRRVALKLLPLRFTNDNERLLRFKHEARTASALNHPNIITIHEIGEEGGTHFIATEYIEGQTLRRRLKEETPTPIEAIEITIQVSAALAAAHQVGIVHRDIKPENIMLRPDGYVKVLDFGLAKLTEPFYLKLQTIDALPFRTDTGVVMGTAHYMSPEQARGLPVDARTDIFNLGIVLYEMLTGHVPFDGETANHVIVSILEKQPLPLKTYLRDITSDLQKIVSRLLCKERDGRFQTVEELIIELKAVKRQLDDAQSSLRPKRGIDRVESGISEHPRGRFADLMKHYKVSLYLTGVTLLILFVTLLAVKQLRSGAVNQALSSPDETPIIDSIFPSSPLDVIGDQNVLIQGKNFQDNIRIIVTFPDGGTGTLCCSQILKLTPTSFVILIDFNGNPGTYSLKAINPNEKNSDLFTFSAQHQVQNPQVTFILPKIPIAIREEQSVQVYGHGFQRGLTVRITFPNGQSAMLSGRQIPEQTTLSFRMLVYFNGDPGTYSIQVVNPNGRKSTPFVFTVT